LYAYSLTPYCCTIRSSLYSIKRHIREEHKSLLSNKDINRYYIVIVQGQALEENKFFFNTATKGKGKGKERQVSIREGVSKAPSLTTCSSPSLSLAHTRLESNNEGVLEPFKLANSLFLNELKAKGEAYYSSEIPLRLSKQEKYSTF
jgi:hypothetical protein